jgi:PAS domain S-box-containing protein
MYNLKKGEQERRRYQTLFDQAPEGYLRTHLDATIQAANRRASALLSVPYGELTGQLFERCIIQEERQMFRAQLARLRRIPCAVDMEVTLETQYGTTFPFALAVYAMHDSGGEWTRLEMLLRNIADAKRLRQDYREWNRFYQTFLETVDAGMVMTSDEGKIMAIHPAGARIFGYEPAALYGQDIRQLYVQLADWERFRKQIETFGSLQDYKIQARRKPGEECDVRSTSTVRWGYDGSIGGDQSICRDITAHNRLRVALVAAPEELQERVAAHTAILRQRNEQLPTEVLERRRTEAALREHNEQRYNLSAGSTQGVLMHRDGRPLFVNQTYTDSFGYNRPKDILAMDSLWLRVAPHERERRAGYHQECLKAQDVPLHCESPGIRRDGSAIWRERTVPLINWEGATAMQSTAIDVTRRKQVEKDVQQSQEKLWGLAANLQKRQEEERKHIAREIHDELGQLLTGLKLDVVWLARQNTQSLPVWQERFAMMTTQIDTLIDTVRRIGTALHPHILDDLGLVAAMEHLLQDMRRRTGMICRLSVPAEELAIAPGRGTALFRIFQEALTNVIRHAHATMVSVRLVQQSGTLLLEVSDNGQGIAFGHTGRRDAFGLRSMRERAALWNGTVEIQGRPGQGTTVTVCMPSGLSQEKEADDSYPGC